MSDVGKDLTIRSYQPGDEEAILTSFNRVFGEVCGEGYVDRDMATWRWQFAQNPMGHRISVAVTPEGQVAAHYAALPVAVASSYGDAVFVQGVDSFTHPDFRRGLKRPGLFVHVAKHCLDGCRERHESWYGYPVIAAERIGRRFLSYHRVCVVDYLCRDASAPSIAVPEGWSTRHVTELDPAVDALEQSLATTKGCALRRSREYLDWRYLRAPDSPYQVHEVRREGELRGLMVLRVQHEVVPGACTIADWVVPEADEDAAAALVAAAHDAARTARRERLMVIFPANSPEHAAMRKLGFEVVPSATYMERPLIIGLTHPQMTVEWLADHWWYTLGDTDLV